MTQPSTRKDKTAKLLARLDTLTPQELKRYLAQELTRKKLGLVWESDLIERDQALNSNLVFPALNEETSELNEQGASGNLIIEGDNFDALRLLKATYGGKIRVILIDPPYNTGNKDWVYNDNFLKKDDRWKHSKWLEFMYQRLTLARDLLTPDGVILICINDENRARLELLMDEVMPGKRLGSFVWRTKDTGNDFQQRFSHVHEHVMVYANSDFKFNGRPTDRSKFRNPDKDDRGDWSPQPLTKAHTYLERENTYYPIQNPITGYWYPCDPNRVWAYASENKIRQLCKGDEIAVKSALGALRSKTIEQLIEEKLIYFPPCESSEVIQFNSKTELLAAIKAGKGPVLPKKKTPLLHKDLPDLDFWVGKPIAPGRPSRKEHWSARPEEVRLAPVSSWISGVNDKFYAFDELDEFETVILSSAKGGVATEEIKNILGTKAFPYPKPLSLIHNLLGQASRPNDIVLDFFAGSGTTGHAVLALNAEDGGNRKFILCSSTEATSKDPDKNLCRDVCAERIRRVINGYGKTPGLGGDFSYLNLDLIEEADLMFEAKAEHAYALLCLRETGVIRSIPKDGSIWPVDNYEGAATVVCPVLNEQTISELQSLKAQRLVVYIDRPDSLIDMWEKAGHASGNLQAYGLETALRWGQLSREHIAGVDEISHFIDDATEPVQKEQA